jgi:RNA polymerase sigma factor (sigma-70 family)
MFLFVFGLLRGFTNEQKMMDSQKLLAEYVKNGSESAFRELVSRYVNLVYSTALRLVGGNAHLAEDVAQTVFIGLARRGRTLSTEVMLGGWLHQHTYHVATKAVRAERRRQSREREAVEMNALQDDAGANLRQVAPILDEAITRLGREDRTAILLRFFEQRDFRSVGEALGSNEDAARMRVNRALEKLHSLLKHRGVTLSAAALGTVLTAGAVTAAPAGLGVTISSVALAGAAAGTGTTLTLLKFMTMTKLKLGLSMLVIAGATTALVVQHQAQIKLREENQSLRQQIAHESLSNYVARAKGTPALRLPAPLMHVTAQPNALPSEDLQSTNLYARLSSNKGLKLTPDQIESYLKVNRRNASSLLAAYSASGDPALLEEAMQKYPDDPQVDLAAVFNKDASPEERRQWLDAFKQSAPDNALANYLSALDYFKAGQTDQAVQELIAASDKQVFQDYRPDRVQDLEEVLSAAYPVAEAEALAMYNTTLMPPPGTGGVRELGHDLVDLANSYRQAGDETSAQAALQIAANWGQNFATGTAADEALIIQIAGINVELDVLSAMNPNSPYDANGQTVQDQLNQLSQQKAALKERVPQVDLLMQTMTDQDWISYCGRCMSFGETAANSWLISKYGQK